MTTFEIKEPDLLNEELRMLREQLRRYVNEQIVPRADAWEAAGAIPRQVILDFGALGFLGMRHPTEYGGGGLGPMASVVLAEELARGCYGGVTATLTVHSDMSIAHIAHRGTHEQKQRYLPGACTGEKLGAICVTEPHAGSDVAGLKTRARRKAGGWVINGSKLFISSAVSELRQPCLSNWRATSRPACSCMAVRATRSGLRSSASRDARILTIGGGATEVMLEEVAKRMRAAQARMPGSVTGSALVFEAPGSKHACRACTRMNAATAR